MAAGHRACALCRREDYNRLTEIWRELHPGRTEPTRSTRSSTRSGCAASHDAAPPTCPTARSCSHDGEPWLVLGAELLRWTPAGYDERVPRPAREQAALVTPPSLVAVLRAGWEPLVPLFHPSAGRHL